MKRDMELIRTILLQLEEKSSGLGTVEIKVDGFDDAHVGYHCALVAEAGLARGINVGTMHSKRPEWKLNSLTWDGHEFLDASREPGRWEKAKEIANKAGGLTLNMMMNVLGQLMNQQLGKLIS